MIQVDGELERGFRLRAGVHVVESPDLLTQVSERWPNVQFATYRNRQLQLCCLGVWLSQDDGRVATICSRLDWSEFDESDMDEVEYWLSEARRDDLLGFIERSKSDDRRECHDLMDREAEYRDRFNRSIRRDTEVNRQRRGGYLPK